MRPIDWRPLNSSESVQNRFRGDEIGFFDLHGFRTDLGIFPIDSVPDLRSCISMDFSIVRKSQIAMRSWPMR